MPNFTAKIRLGYSDIDGLILDCRHNDLADDGSVWINRAPPARAVVRGTHTGADNSATLVDAGRYWNINQLAGKTIYNLTDGSAGIITANTQHEVTASLSGGTDDDWDEGDAYRITTPRFGNPYQDVVANRPVVSTVGSYKQAAFSLANSHHFKVPLAYDLLATDLTAAFEFFQGGSTANNQVVLGFPNFHIARRNGSGNFEYRADWLYGIGSGDMADGTWMFTHQASSIGRLFRNNSVAVNGAATLVSVDAGDPSGRIGSIAAGGQYCDMILRSMQIWNRRMSPIEVDFAYKTLSPETEYHSLARPDMERRIWTDETLSVSRINPNRMASHKFVVARFPTGSSYRVQVAAQVNGETLPDSKLGGDLFAITPAEIPVSSNPAVYQDAGWSSVFDIEIWETGHYTYCLSRSNGGSIILHFDAIAETP